MPYLECVTFQIGSTCDNIFIVLLGWLADGITRDSLKYGTRRYDDWYIGKRTGMTVLPLLLVLAKMNIELTSSFEVLFVKKSV